MKGLSTPGCNDWPDHRRRTHGVGPAARQIDHALRPFRGGVGVPLILAAAKPLDSIYRSVNSYP